MRELAGSRQFMGADNQIFPSFSEAYDYLYNNKEKFDVREMTTFYSTYSKYSFQSTTLSTSTMRKKIIEPKTKPRNSKFANKKTKENTTDPKLKERQKKRRGRKPGCMDVMRPKNDDAFNKLRTLVDGKAPIEEIGKAVAHLKTFGWYLDPKMVQGWLKFNPHNSPIQYLIITPFCEKFTSKTLAIASLKSRLRKNEIDRELLIKFIICDTHIEHKLDAENEADWEGGHQSVPSGWKLRRNPDDRENYEFLTKENICFSSMLSAFRVINMDECFDLFSVQEHLELQGKLQFEGWVESACLPTGWKINRTSSNSSFLTKTGQVLSDTNSVMTFIMDPVNKISSNERRMVMKNISKLFFNASPAYLAPLILRSDRKKQIKHPKLPKDWSFEKLSDKVIKITAATGEVFFSRLQALEFMIEQDVECQFLFSLWDTLEDEDWLFGCNYVPDGWGVRRLDNNVLFLTAELTVLTSVDQALDYIENEDDYEPKDYKVLNDWKEIYISGVWIEDIHLPEGWRKTELRLETDEEEAQTEHYLSPTTDIYSGRVALIDHLIATKHQATDIVKLWTTLDTESWMLDSHQVRIPISISHIKYQSSFKTKLDLESIGSSLGID